MTERENLPAVLAAQAVAVLTERRVSLVGRGLAAVQNSKNANAQQTRKEKIIAMLKSLTPSTRIAVLNAALEQKMQKTQNDALYRQAREVYDHISNQGLFWFSKTDGNDPMMEAFNTFDQLAAENYGKAYFPRYSIYEHMHQLNSAIVEPYKQLAINWLRANQSLDDPEIWHDLGVTYGVENIELAIHWLQKSVDAGNVSSMWELVGAYECSEDWDKARYWQIKAAEAGHNEAQRGLEMQHERGHLGVVDEQVFNWYVWSAEQGHLWAQLFLAEAYRSGDVVELDSEQAVYWLTKAAELGDKDSQHELGSMYKEGHYVARDYELARYWYCKAAEQGDDLSQIFLAEMYEDGRGIKDDKQAAFWFRKALGSLRDTHAKKGLKRLGIDWKKK